MKWVKDVVGNPAGISSNRTTIDVFPYQNPPRKCVDAYYQPNNQPFNYLPFQTIGGSVEETPVDHAIFRTNETTPT